MSEIVKQNISKIEQKKRGNPNWYKGMPSPNPKGARLGQERLSALFTKAFLEDAEKHKGYNLFKHAFAQARSNNGVLIALLNKFVPDLLKGEGFDGKDIAQFYQGIAPGDLRALIARLRESISE